MKKGESCGMSLHAAIGGKLAHNLNSGISLRNIGDFQVRSATSASPFGDDQHGRDDCTTASRRGSKACKPKSFFSW